MKLTKSQLKEMIKEELLNEQMDIRSAFYQLGDAIENLEWLNHRNTTLNKDRTIVKITKQMKKTHDQLYKHLEKTYEGWD